MKNDAKSKYTEEKKLKDTIEVLDEQIESVTKDLENLHTTGTDTFTQASLRKMYVEKKKN